MNKFFGVSPSDIWDLLNNNNRHHLLATIHLTAAWISVIDANRKLEYFSFFCYVQRVPQMKLLTGNFQLTVHFTEQRRVFCQHAPVVVAPSSGEIKQTFENKGQCFSPIEKPLCHDAGCSASNFFEAGPPSWVIWRSWNGMKCRSWLLRWKISWR